MKEMYPNEPEQNQQNPYEFIMNPQQPSKRNTPIPGVKDPFIARLILIVVVVVAVVVIVGVVASQLLSRNQVNTADLIGLAQSQQELIRVANQGATNGTQPVTRNFAINVQLALRSEQLQLLAYLQSQGHKLSATTLSLKKSKTTDTQLTTAQQTSTFDSTFVQLMQNSLTAYNTEVQQVLAGAAGANEKKILNVDQAAATMLLQQVPTQESVQAGS
ncbi:MAG TPA: hypothetical protein VLG11_04115 [Candidatus Saccharimonadales bacterium]|nr:hypothetical protein [Candidatus Saccharimonadales bacterium]